MVIPPAVTVSKVVSTASISPTQNKQSIVHYKEINGVVRVEATITLYDRHANLITHKTKGTGVDNYG
jgi:hypothetical protein